MHPALRAFGLLSLAVAAYFLALLGLVQAHEFYDAWCCDGRDCKAYHGKVEITPQGYYVPEFDQLIPYKDAAGAREYAEQAGTRYNVPETGPEYSICMMPHEVPKIRCFYAKPGGV